MMAMVVGMTVVLAMAPSKHLAVPGSMQFDQVMVEIIVRLHPHTIQWMSLRVVPSAASAQSVRVHPCTISWMFLRVVLRVVPPASNVQDVLVLMVVVVAVVMAVSGIQHAHCTMRPMPEMAGSIDAAIETDDCSSLVDHHR